MISRIIVVAAITHCSSRPFKGFIVSFALLIFMRATSGCA
ncbi:Uncharacterised protein [Mycobacterium tuberculosis]|uniref:Uncharacterized protein n=1 Tax=Mycobacterium tuberculosis TaxID=1773 RepID=A0A0U0RIA6_MYCTX|nr:Uncharacterised protein [Mycobacterium tuberculosis]COW08352.1 Uncharacterised protein [Mycobacterium tuberculosis]COW30442.1 Uncharacterised protein [Mycobacterium tuberculosis]COW76388.1 Uncharacterised protein [Mycobacterium tuberculosis]